MMPSAIAATPARSMAKVSLAPVAGVAARLLALAEEPVGAGAHVGDEDLARRRGVHPHLAQRARLLETLHPAVEDERQDLALARAGCHRRACR